MAQKRILTQHLTLAEVREDAEYSVEELRKNRWRTVGGPFDTKDEADTFAAQYSRGHPGVPVRVVVFH